MKTTIKNIISFFHKNDNNVSYFSHRVCVNIMKTDKSKTYDTCIYFVFELVCICLGISKLYDTYNANTKHL